jgi:hypothetical protein
MIIENKLLCVTAYRSKGAVLQLLLVLWLTVGVKFSILKILQTSPVAIETHYKQLRGGRGELRGSVRHTQH